MTTLQERPFFFLSGSRRLFAIFHAPRGAQRNESFVFCYPEFEEKLWAHRVFVGFARMLASRGYPVLRFDFAGHGDSDGDFRDTSVASRLADVDAAVRTLGRETGLPVSLLGLRFGATLAATYAEQAADVRRLVLWEPVTSGAQHMQELLLSNLATQSAVYGEVRHTRADLTARLKEDEVVNIEGYELTRTLFEEASALTLAGARRFPGACLIVQIGRQDQKLRKELEALRAAYAGAELVSAAEEPFWKEIKTFYPRADRLFAATLEWMERHG